MGIHQKRPIKENCMNQKTPTKETCIQKKTCVHIKRDLQKRPNDSPDIPKRRIYIKIDLFISKETCIHQKKPTKRPTKET